MINMGVCYFYKRDRGFRPIFCVNVAQLVKFGKDDPQIVGMFGFLLNFALTRGLVPGHVENLTCLVDARDVGLTWKPKKQMKEVGR